MKKFPDEFFFGAATSSHQIEGDCINEWSEWEKENAIRLADIYLRSSAVYSKQFSGDGSDPENYISGKAVDHYNRFDEDFAIAAKLGLNAYRFSIEWSRIEPADNEWDQHEIEHYRKVIDSLHKKNIEPFVTIWHWTLPLWLSSTGGVMNEKFIFYFARYAAKLAESFGDKVKFYITINEPEIYSLNSYMLGKWPPMKKGILPYYQTISVLIKAHQAAYRNIKAIRPETNVGPACNMTFFESGGGPLNHLATIIADRLWNKFFIRRISSESDYIGLNYYFHNRIRYGFNKNRNEIVSDMGWELYPEGIYHLLHMLRRFRLPVYITENGLADADDSRRGKLIEDTLKYVYRAIQEGCDVRGYFHWSLLDNFEWDKGFWPKFGLVSVDRKTMKRTVRKSAETYTRIIKRGLDL